MTKQKDPPKYPLHWTTEECFLTELTEKLTVQIFLTCFI